MFATSNPESSSRQRYFGRSLALMLMASAILVTDLASSALASEPEVLTVAAREVPKIEWDTALRKFQFDAKKYVGQRLTVRCPPMPSDATRARIHGTDFYPSETPICLAALHAGVIDQSGGVVTVQLNPGRKDYAGSERNGVTSSDLPETKRCFSFVGGPAADETNKLHLANLPRVKFDTNFTVSGFGRRNLIGQRFTMRCGDVPKDRMARLVFGTDDYAFDSKIGWAALHAGKITRDGGILTVQINPTVKQLVGSIRNGVETRSKTYTLRTIAFVDNPVGE